MIKLTAFLFIALLAINSVAQTSNKTYKVEVDCERLLRDRLAYVEMPVDTFDVLTLVCVTPKSTPIQQPTRGLKA
jgi:hypothetical protein